MGLGIPSTPAPPRPTGRPELVSSSAKTRHTARHDSGGGHELPPGPPMLMWSSTSVTDEPAGSSGDIEREDQS